MSKYTLVEKTSEERKTFVVTIVGDSNDADYITEIEHYDQEGFEEALPELINLRDNYGGSHELSDFPNEYDLLTIPYNGFDGNCHTLEELTVEYIDENGKVWDVQF